MHSCWRRTSRPAVYRRCHLCGNRLVLPAPTESAQPLTSVRCSCNGPQDARFAIPVLGDGRPPGEGAAALGSRCLLCYVAEKTASGLWWKTFKRLWTAKMSAASLSAAARPGRMNLQKPRFSFVSPKTGSTVCERVAYIAAPSALRSRCSIASSGLALCGGGPVVSPISRAALRRFQSLAVAMRRSGPSAVALSSDQ
jgi:hypothetical protein